MRIVVKIFLIIAIACSGVTIALLLLKVEPRVKTAEEDSAKYKKSSEEEAQAKVKAEGERDATNAVLVATAATLETTKASLANAEQEAVRAKDDKQKAEQTLSSVQGEYNTWKQNHKDFVDFGRTVQQVMKTEADLKSTTLQRDTFDKENRLLNVKVTTQGNEIGKLRSRLGLPNPPTLPPGLAGKVIAVDPKFQFVVLDIGNRQHAKFPGEMIVTRNGKYIGKVRIDDVKEDYSVANILKEWTQKGESLLEGDLVMAEANK